MKIDTATYYLKAYDRYTEDFLTTFSKFDKRAFNLAPAEDKWSPGQLLEHMGKSERGTLRLLNGPVAHVEGRVADAKCAELEDFIHTRERLRAPEGLYPTQATYAPAAVLDAFTDVRAEIRTAFEFAADIAAVVDAWHHPRYGAMTVCEWLYFTAVHGERHRRQYAGLAAER